MKTIIITLQERWEASKTKIHKSKKTYDRKKQKEYSERTISQFIKHI